MDINLLQNYWSSNLITLCILYNYFIYLRYSGKNLAWLSVILVNQNSNNWGSTVIPPKKQFQLGHFYLHANDI